MRILVISNRYPPAAVGGYEIMCAAIAERLRDGHEVLVLTSTLGRGAAPGETGVLRALPLLGDARRAIALAPLAAIRAARATRRVLATYRPDLVYVWNGSEIPQAVIAVVAERGLPLVYSVQEHWFGRLYTHDPFMRYLIGDEHGLRALWSRVARLVNRHPALRLDAFAPTRAAVTWCSEALRALTPTPFATTLVLERTILPATPRTVAYSLLERRPQGPLTIAFVGRIVGPKGPQIAYRALAELRDRHGVDARLVLAGPEPDRPSRRALARIARELDIADRVEFCGALDEEALGLLFQRVHALVVPSLWEEPFGVVCLEAACARVPVVAARSGGMPEILRDGEHALFFDRGDAGACADALASTLTDAAATEQRVQRAFGRTRQLSFERYRIESERFLEDAAAALAGDATASPTAARQASPSPGG